jgi:hypothetical protein
MDIEKFIPDVNPNWVVRHDILYYKKGGLIPILKKIDGNYFVSLDRRATKKVTKLMKKLQDMGIIFYLCDRMTIVEKHIYNQDIERIIRNYLLGLSDENFFNYIQNSNFDYIQNLTDFLNMYDCHRLFKKVYDSLLHGHFAKVTMDWYTRTKYNIVENVEIRDFYQILERQIKLNIFFS